jgi:hypothetical protein
VNPTVRDAASTAVAVCVLVGLTVRYLLVPYLRDHLVLPIREVQKQVTENHHATPEAPTIPDRIEDVHAEVRALARVMDTHISWSDREHHVMDRKLRALRKQIKRHHPTNGDKAHEQSPGT